jgi:hypothetical protein
MKLDCQVHSAATEIIPSRVFPMRFAGHVVRRFLLAFGALGLVVLASADCVAGEKLPPAAAGPVDFIHDVKPIFVERCYECHSAKKQEAGLRLDRRTDALAGGDSGLVLQPGKSADSLLIQYVSGLDQDTVMPPEGDRLTAQQVGVLRAWIDRGMPWPEEADSPSTAASSQAHWSFQPLKRPALPAVRQVSWVRNPIDRFILTKLEGVDIEPSPEAERATLIRRLYLDLLGLPPTPEAIEAFVEDDRANAYEDLVDELLASPHFGERWGRHWLDLARYADSNGYENDKPRPDAWRYRDWVIDAFNNDMPFDQFTVEQMAGDLLPDAPLEQKIATGFHRMSLSNGTGGSDKEEFRIKAIKDRVNTTGTVWLGLTLGCCQCHSHKYDPILHREYYQLFAFFNRCDDTNIPLGPKKEQALTVSAAIRDSHVHLRGDFLNLGAKVEPGTPGFLPPLPQRGAQPDRLDFARWLVAAENPLTPRVAVNHIWQYLFGQPLVPTVDNFGQKGEPPSHPELLDWLATEFLARSWSRKEMIRLIVTSATYRQSSRSRPELVELDPNNALLARQNRFRVEGEVIRDLALAVSGLLSDRVGGPSMQPPLPDGLNVKELMREGFVKSSSGSDRYRRGLYIQVQRTLPYPMLQAFDVPDGNESCGQRDRSTTPMQALTVLNDPVFFECAQVLGRRLAESDSLDSSQRLSDAWRTCLGRRPLNREQAIMDSLLAEHRQFYSDNSQYASEAVGDVPLPTAVSVVEVASWIAVARTLLNVDEFSTRE